MYNTLLQLPLFQGLCHDDLTHIIDKVKLDFSRNKAEDMMIEAGSECDRLVFVLKGDCFSTTTSADGALTVKEQHKAPYVIEPHSLFGLNPHYTSTYVALTDVQTVSIHKSCLVSELLTYDIFRLNYVNMICCRAQTMNGRIWQNSMQGDPIDKVIYFILLHTEKSSEKKVIKMKMQDMACYVDEPKVSVSKVLNLLQEEGLLELKRKEIIVEDPLRLQQRLTIPIQW
jgi:CRP-like cAMP-binding protein